MNVADYLLECADPRASALVGASRQFSNAELRNVAARVTGEFLLLFCPIAKPEPVPDAVHGPQALPFALVPDGSKVSFLLPVIGKPTARSRSA